LFLQEQIKDIIITTISLGPAGVTAPLRTVAGRALRAPWRAGWIDH
jgi:hypothetical protein